MTDPEPPDERQDGATAAEGEGPRPGGAAPDGPRDASAHPPGSGAGQGAGPGAGPGAGQGAGAGRGPTSGPGRPEAGTRGDEGDHPSEEAVDALLDADLVAVRDRVDLPHVQGTVTKVEGLAVVGPTVDGVRLLATVDADDPAAPSLAVGLRVRW